ncbi:sodium:solute symporter family transporter [Edaphobacter flagellatus]|uniref:sodium:solute symporter family transporter n=1 Tax=Edaphobacter flagellatus TaxID=1933044 RepID=UPI0021B3301D|nr:hypothetical protein [Edaphobacter flagellatus]
MPTIRLTLPDNIVIFGYFFLVLGIGIWFRRTQRTAEDYFAGGHQISWWLAGISHYMSGFSAFTFVVYSEIAYRYGLPAILLFWTSVPACILGGWLFAWRWRRARIITPVEFLEQRCNLRTRQLFAWAAIPAKLFEDALKIFTTSLFLSAGIGMEIRTSILLCAVIVIVYTLLGGLLALVVTDYVQFLMKTLAVLLLLPLAIWHLGGISPALHSIPSDLWRPVSGPYGWVYLISYAIIVFISYNGGWSFAQKYYSVPDEASARKAAYLAAALNFIGTPIMLLPAMMAHKLIPNISSLGSHNIYVNLLFRILPAGMIGIIVAALFSATMATVSADINAIASVLTRDFYQRILNPAATDARLVAVGRIATLLLGIIIMALALWIAESHRESLFHMMVTAFGILLAPTLLPLLSALLFRRLNSGGVLSGFFAGMLSGVVTLAAKTFYLRSLGPATTEALDYKLEGFSIIINVAVTCLAMLVGSRAFPSSEDERQRAATFFCKLDTPVTKPSPPIELQTTTTRTLIHISTGCVGFLLALSGFFSDSTTARTIDGTLGAALISLSLFRLRNNIFRRQKVPQ